MNFLTMILTLLVTFTNPTITATGSGFDVTFEKGAVGACTIFQDQTPIPDSEPSLKEVFPDGHYAPRHCYLVEPTSTGYGDDWDFIVPDQGDHTTWKVWVEVQYMNGGPEVLVTVKSPTLTVKR